MSLPRNPAEQAVLGAGALVGHWFGRGTTDERAQCDCGLAGTWPEGMRHRVLEGCAELERRGQLPAGTALIAAVLLGAGFTGTLDDLATAAGVLVDVSAPDEGSLENPSTARSGSVGHGRA